MTSKHIDAFIQALNRYVASDFYDGKLKRAASLLKTVLIMDGYEELILKLESACSKDDRLKFGKVFAEAINITPQADGELSLWLIPVVVDYDKALPLHFPLSASSFASMRLRGLLQRNLNCGGDTAGGWAFPLPLMLDTHSISLVEAGRLASFPQQVREFVQGDRLQLPTMYIAQNRWVQRSVPALYFMPIVSFNKHQRAPRNAPADNQIGHIVREWVFHSIPQRAPVLAEQIFCGGQAHLFTHAYYVGRRECREIALRAHLTEALKLTRLPISSLCAASRVIGSADEPALLISIQESYEGRHLRDILLPVRNGDAVADLLFACDVLVKMGITDHRTDVAHIETFVPSSEMPWAIRGLRNIRVQHGIIPSTMH